MARARSCCSPAGWIRRRRRRWRGARAGSCTASPCGTARSTRASSTPRAASPRRSASRDTSNSTSTCARSAARRSSATARSRKTGLSTDRSSDSNPPIPSTYVPARNTVLLSLALAWAEVLGRRAHRDRRERARLLRVSRLPAGVHRRVRVPGDLATRAGVEGRPLRIWAPLQHLTKAGIIRVGLELGVDYGLTHSCYDPGPDGRPCGRCDSCQLRARGFAEAGVADPLLSPRG